jgi:proline-specific peptidase
MTANSASVVSRMKVLLSPEGMTATWRFSATATSGDCPSSEVPLIVVPGGPGLPHSYLRCLAALAGPGRPVVFYDPHGCGPSELRSDTAATTSRFSTLVDEFDRVIDHFAGPDGCFVLGHSSGGWIALEAMLRDATIRSRIAKLVLASVPLDVPAFVEAQTALIVSLGAGAHRRLRNRPPTRGRSAVAYNRDYERFLHTFICRPPWPPEVVEAMAQSNRELYETLWGPSEVCVTGELRNWSCTDRAGALEMPILLTSGRYDEVTPVLVEDAIRLLPTAGWCMFENSAHMPHLEEPDHYLDIVGAFL